MGKIPPWSDLPQELLSAIANFLDSNPIDLLRFRAVCKSWFSSLSLPLNILSPCLPLTTPRPPSSLRARYSCIYSSDSLALSATVIYVLHPSKSVNDIDSSSKTWLLFVDQLNPGKVSIRQPFTRWSFAMPLDFPRGLNLLDFNVSEIGRYYNLSFVYTRGDKFIKPGVWSSEVFKVVLLSNGLAVVALFEGGKLGLLRLWLGNNGLDTEWEIVHDGKGFRFDDIVEFKDRILGVDRRGRVYVIGCLSSDVNVNVIVPPITGGGGRRKRLVESLGLLYLVVRYHVRETRDETTRFRVYVLNEKMRKWVEVSSLGDQIFLLGIDFSFSVSAQEFKGSCGKNCIIFKERSFQKYDGGNDDYQLFYGIGRNDLHIGVFHLEDGARVGVIGSYPGYSDVMWPPPGWLWPNNKLKLRGTVESTINRLLMGIRDENLKAKFIELSPLVGAVASDGIKDAHILDILRDAHMFQKFLNEIVLEIDKESKSIKEHIIEDAVSRFSRSKSENLPDQVGTSNLGTEETQGCTGSSESTTQHSVSDDWLSSEMTRRLGTHIELNVLLRGIIRVLEKHADKLEGIQKFCQESGVSAEDMARLSPKQIVIRNPI